MPLPRSEEKDVGDYCAGDVISWPVSVMVFYCLKILWILYKRSAP